MTKMNVVALVSGGKDSTFNMMHCIAHGHNVVALANLYPSGPARETDSYMYQTVAQDVVPLMAECMNLPLIRQEITGSPKNLESEYIIKEGDEVEDLYLLLSNVKVSIIADSLAFELFSSY